MRVYVVFVFLSSVLATLPQWWQNFGESSPPHGPISICRVENLVLAVEHNTKDLYSFSPVTTTWQKIHSSQEHTDANLPESGVPLGDGCLFYGGSYGNDNTQFTFVRPTGAWNQVQGAPNSDEDQLFSYFARASETVIAHVDPFVFILTNTPAIPGAGYLLQASSTPTAMSTADGKTTLFLSVKMYFHRGVRLIWGVGPHLFVISTESKDGGEARFDKVLVTETGLAEPHLGIAQLPATLVAALEQDWIGAAKLDVNMTAGPSSDQCNSQEYTVSLVYIKTDGVHTFSGRLDMICGSRLNKSAVPAVYRYLEHTFVLQETMYTTTPPPRMAAAFAVMRLPQAQVDVAFYAGGFANGVVLNDTWLQSVSSGSWKMVPEMTMEPRAFAQTVVWRETMYIIGGHGATQQISPSALVISTDGYTSWVSANPTAPDPTWAPPTPLWGHAASLAEGTARKLCSKDCERRMGGTTLGQSFMSMSHAFFTVIFRRARDYADVVYMTGGWNTPNVWAYRLSLARMSWLEPVRVTPSELFDPPLYYHSMVCNQYGSLVIYGGLSNGTEATYLASTFYTNSEPQWIGMPVDAPSGTNAPTIRYGAAFFQFGAMTYCAFGGQSFLGSTDSLECNILYTADYAVSLENAPEAVMFPSRSASGWYSDEGDTECTQCPAGRYSPFKGQSGLSRLSLALARVPITNCCSPVAYCALCIFSQRPRLSGTGVSPLAQSFRLPGWV
ncbi:hypothetical protein PAPYR_5812 [Paratrimastix pyriformis]|uniref:Uncharacterized protein n=1 Tax=Paratrimastix pyriformis TaxID=342808 RepID=A0ABQ8UGP1_9EUKA|nr:hypothetical protein PAPYR_5812 [Paratrimastix pyriformis]